VRKQICKTNFKQGHGCRKDFSRGDTRRFFQNVSRWGPKVAKFIFSHSKLQRKFFSKIFKIREGTTPPSDAHEQGEIQNYASVLQLKMPGSLFGRENNVIIQRLDCLVVRGVWDSSNAACVLPVG